MKNRIGSFLCAAALLMGLATLPATACAGNMGTSSSGHEDPDFDDWLVVTGRDFAGACLSYMLEGIPIKAERLQIAFPSTMETIELHQGKIIRYTGLIHAPGAQGRKNLRKMAFSPEGTLKAIGGDKDKALMVYALNADMGDEPLDISALTLRLDGKECKLRYSMREKEYMLSCK